MVVYGAVPRHSVFVVKKRSRKRRVVILALLVFAVAVALLVYPTRANIPVALVKYVRPVVSDHRGHLHLPEHVKERLGGRCMRIDKYEIAKRTSDWQCGQSLLNPVFPIRGHENLGYRPSKTVLTLLAKETGTTVEELRSMAIFSGDGYRASKGRWCGMPVAGGFEAFLDLSPEERRAYQYWVDCVSRLSGYFNVLQCRHGTKTAVLGFAAIEPGVCYPAHAHQADEAYWQIAGGGRWRTWDWHEVDGHYHLTTEIDLKGAKHAIHVNQREHPHEFDTTADDAPMVLIYWWGLDSTIPNDYSWVPEVRKARLNVTSCGTTDRIPDTDTGTVLQLPELDDEHRRRC
ncbi:hypothetical protein CTAYLR_001338 [Chrysophaeum taylorii]|uniref:Cupin domain-containing protein n=1 Tax=Chrysophaeum taylorii TaxID=2483200 RepID=A0AAD7U763_9STRA|nr:hypothetical protein CTAYLR_001338 [Chrysophaeum taylorii]